MLIYDLVQGYAKYLMSTGKDKLIAVYRHTSSYLRCYDTTSPSTTTPQPYTLAITTSTYSTSPTRSRSSSTKSSTRRWIHSHRLTKLSSPLFYPSYPPSRNT